MTSLAPGVDEPVDLDAVKLLRDTRAVLSGKPGGSKDEEEEEALSGEGGPVVEPFKAPRFCPTTQVNELKAFLAEYGWVRVAAISSDSPALAEGVSSFWDFLESIPGTAVSRTSPLSWGSDTDWLPSPTNGIEIGRAHV